MAAEPAVPEPSHAPARNATDLTPALIHRYASLLERYELLFQATHDVLYDLDLTTGKVQWNESLYTVYGYNKHEPAHTIEWWTKHVHPDDALRLERELDEFLSGSSLNWEYEYRFQLADSTYIEVRDRGFVIRDDSGEATRLVGSFLDITKQHQLNRAKDEFISLASHQLKTPLSVIRTYSEMLAAGMLGELTPKQRRHVDRITAATIRLIRLVNGVLNISRFEMNNLEAKKVRTNLVTCVSYAIAEVSEQAHDRGVKITFDPEPGPVTIRTDKIMLDHIVNNILVNAITYSRGSGGTVTVKLAKQHGSFVISVKDNGIGIPLADQSAVFTRFYRASNAINASDHGSGLGLYLVRLLTDALGGQIWFRSREAAGTTFYIRLPAE